MLGVVKLLLFTVLLLFALGTVHTFGGSIPASDTGIFKVRAVVDSEWVRWTQEQTSFSSSAVHLIENNGTHSSSKSSTCKCLGTCKVSRQNKFSCCFFLQFPLLNMLTSLRVDFSPVVENPSCLHTTVASGVPQASSQTVPHWLLLQTSTRPSSGVFPLASRMAPWVQGAAERERERESI